MDAQTTARVMMIRPAHFAGNVQTQASNRFQSATQARDAAEVQRRAQREFDALVMSLDAAGVQTLVFEDRIEVPAPDAVFPNNWVSFHADGSVVLYPMLAANRRLERREDVLQALSAAHQLRISRVIDLTGSEAAGRYLEGTGSLVLDRSHRIAYACLSPRTDPELLGEFAQQLDYDVIAFEARDAADAAIYHTNVMMCVGEKFAAVCTQSIREDEREPVLKSLRDTHHEVIELTLAQIAEFAGNMLELKTRSGSAVVAMSARAHAALTPHQRSTIERCAGPIIATPIPTIEQHGGGSVRCMLAEIFLPSKAASGPAHG